MKTVQHWLNTLIHEEAWATKPSELGDSEPDFCDPDKRRQYFFGKYWSGYNYDALSPDEAKSARSEFDGKLRSAFAKLAAVLIASTNPTCREDAVESWWWDLPDFYASIPDLEARADTMRTDVNRWIQDVGIWVYEKSGTGDQVKFNIEKIPLPGDLPDIPINPTQMEFEDVKLFGPIKNTGGYDFVLTKLIHFMYLFREIQDSNGEFLLEDESLEVLIRKRWPTQHRLFARMIYLVETNLSQWTESSIPFSGQDIDQEFFNIQYDLLVLTETENHILMVLAHYFLMNQWIYKGYRGTPLNEEGLPDYKNLAPTDLAEPREWFAFSDKESEVWKKTRDALARIMHKGFFETNAYSYQHHTIQPLLTLASFAEDDTIRTEAENALHFLATKYAFQSIDGRRYKPMRRNCEEAYNLRMYDGISAGFGLLSGAFNWNDSPYGLKMEPEACMQAEDDSCDSCPWKYYTWKTDRGAYPDGTLKPSKCVNDQGDPDKSCEACYSCTKIDDCDCDNFDCPAPDDSEGEQIPGTAAQLANDVPIGGTEMTIALWFAFSDYRLPGALQDFMIHKYDGSFARMTSQYDRDDYPLEIQSPLFFSPVYFEGNQVFDGPNNNERVPEFYFSTSDFNNVAGGIYNHLYEGSLGLKGEGKRHEIPANPFPPVTTTCAASSLGINDKSLEQYDFLSRPYTILPQVPEVTGPKGEVIFYKPFGTGPYNSCLDQLNNHLPFMLGYSERFHKSSNIATYKNFSYGYRTKLKFSKFGELEGLDWCLKVPLVYEKMDMEFPFDLPPSWTDQSVPKVEFDIGIAKFRIYDLRAQINSNSQAGFYLITARVRKKAGTTWSRKVSRGFWEVVPGDMFDHIFELEEQVKALNPKKHFKKGYTCR